MFTRNEESDMVGKEYGGLFRRIFPWAGVSTPEWGGALMTLAPEDSSIPHDHDEEEAFFIISGEGVMTVDGESKLVKKGDFIYLPRFSQHKLKNSSSVVPLELICIWWGAPKNN